MNDNGSAGDDLTDEWRDELLDAPERAALPKWDEAQARLWLEQAWFNELSEMAQIIAADLTRWLKKSYWNHSPLDWDPRTRRTGIVVCVSRGTRALRSRQGIAPGLSLPHRPERAEGSVHHAGKHALLLGPHRIPTHR